MNANQTVEEIVWEIVPKLSTWIIYGSNRNEMARSQIWASVCFSLP